MGGKLCLLRPEPGISRDGTDFSSRKWIDGEWTRFYRGLPQKMGGYKEIIGSTHIPRGTIIVPHVNHFDVYIGDERGLSYFLIDSSGNLLTTMLDRTPTPFNISPNNEWSFDVMYSTISNESILIAYVGQNLNSIENDFDTPIYYGNISPSPITTPFIPTGNTTSGGVLVLHPFLMFFGNNGEVSWTAPNDPTTVINSARVTGSKIITGARTRGGSESPAGLLWSLDSLLRVTNTGPGPEDFNFDTVTDQSSIISNKCIIQQDSTYYWCAVDRFLYYNGVVQELPNDSCLEFFFGELNYSQRQKVWATKISKWGEIWWYFPRGTSTECNHAVIYNYREKTWYDTPISRSIGDFDQTFQFPIWCDNEPDEVDEYIIWQHEYGTDKVQADETFAIRAFITTPDMSLCAFGPDLQFNGADRWMQLDRFEPDFIITGDMTLTVLTQTYAQAPTFFSAPLSFDENTTKLDLRGPQFQGRLMSITFESDVIGGAFQMGQVLLLIKLGDGRQ